MTSWLAKHPEVVDALVASNFDFKVLRKFDDCVPYEWACNRGLVTLTDDTYLTLPLEEQLEYLYKFMDIHTMTAYVPLEVCTAGAMELFEVCRSLTSPNAKNYILNLAANVLRTKWKPKVIKHARINADGTVRWNHTTTIQPCSASELLMRWKAIFEVIKVDLKLPFMKWYYPEIIPFVDPGNRDMQIYITHRRNEKSNRFKKVHEELLAYAMHPDRLHRLGKEHFIASMV